jgi:hypothetical protein
VVAGLSLIALGALLLLGVSVHSGYLAVWPAFLTIGAGYGLTSTPMAAAALGAVPAGRTGMASATNNTARQIGGVFGIAILGSLLPPARRAGRILTSLIRHASCPSRRAVNSWRARRWCGSLRSSAPIRTSASSSTLTAVRLRHRADRDSAELECAPAIVV